MGMTKFLVSVALGAAFVSAPVLAQGYGGFMQDQTRQQAQQMADRMFQQLDLNHDGTLTRAEAEQAVTQFAASRGGGDNGGRGAGRMERMIDRTFGAAQSLTLPQFEAQALARFDAMDLNHDGTVTAAERQQAREMRAQAQPPAQPQTQPQRQ
jgi:Ca2+-binding EF-hand superfamily protein